MKALSPYQFKGDRFSSHTQIAAKLWTLAAIAPVRPFVVLDVGCASGFLRQFLPSPDFYLIGNAPFAPDIGANLRRSDFTHLARVAEWLDRPARREAV